MNNQKQETFTRSDIEASLKKKFPNLSKFGISEAIDAILESIVESVALDEKVEIRGFGTYKVTNKKARIGRNPKNSEPVQIPEKKAIKWKMSKTFFNRLNKNFTENEISDTY